MEYECQVIPVNKLILGAGGFIPPLCNDCKCPDCSNPIKEMSLSIMGVPRKVRLWEVNRVVKQVVACKGYISEKDIVDEEEEKNGLI